MHNKVLCILLAVCVGSLAFAGKPEITNNGTFYIYSFFWQNGDFNSEMDDYGDQFFYMHADVGIHADFGAGVSSQVTLGGWGTFGVHPITAEGEQGDTPGENVGVREAYIDFANLFDSPLSFRAGKMHVLYPGQVFDGGEDGVMGAKFYGSTDVVDYDLAWYRLIENGGCRCVGLGPVEDDLDLFAAYFTAKFVEGAVRLSPYWFWRTQSMTAYDTLEQPYEVKDDPMWLGGRLDVGPIAGFSLNGEFTMMTGKSESAGTEVDYKGMHYMGKLSYAPPTLPIVLGGGYYVFTGDELDTLGFTGDENELYESPIWGPYTNDFYNWWPAFGPAHLHKTAYGFNLLAPFDMYATNLAVINGNIGFTQGPFMLRGDFFKYSRNWVMDGMSDDMGMEFALLTTYTYKKTITVGATGGYWMPGDWQDDFYDLMVGPGDWDDPMLAGWLFAFISF
jgi:hypothetical protein